MARNTNVPFKGRIQKRKTYHLQIITFRLQRAAGPYRWARSRPRLSISQPGLFSQGIYPNPELTGLLKNLVPSVAAGEEVLLAIFRQAKIRRWRKARELTRPDRKEACS